MANAFFDAHSMYHQTDPIVVDGITTIGSWNRPSWMITRPDSKYIHRYMVPGGQSGRPDLISQTIYNVDDLDWVIIMFNNIQDVFGWPKTGEVIEFVDESIVFPSL